MIEDFIYSKLKGLVKDRVYPVQAPENTPAPYIVYKQVSGVETDSGGTLIKSDRWQIDSFPVGYREGKELVKQIRLAFLSGLSDSICVIRTEFDGPEDLFDTTVERHYQSTDLLIDYQE